MNQNYTIEQQTLLNHVDQKVITLFEETPVPAHGIDHSSRVAKWIAIIAREEHARSPFLCELSGWLHDIGRVREKEDDREHRGHQELSYIMLKEWFADDRAFDVLSNYEKRELLYSVRYHWNNAANKYDTAWILRDADKLDLLGEEGLQRSKEFFGDAVKSFERDIRLKYDSYYWLKTETAKQIVEKRGLLNVIDEFYISHLEDQIEEIQF